MGDRSDLGGQLSIIASTTAMTSVLEHTDRNTDRRGKMDDTKQEENDR